MSQPVLKVTDLRAGYGDAPVIRGLSVAVGLGEAAVIIGPNGHGKTTLLRAISGLLRPAAGTV
jgi:ABC-type branched-subunit amino acid transport system ATPase component